jgi:hypothetical protein
MMTSQYTQLSWANALSVLAFLPRISLQQAITVDVPGSVPPDASKVVPHDFPSLGFEVTSFADYAGNSSHPNIFSKNLINALQSKLGTSINIRVGGTSGDHDHYDASQTDTAVVIPSNNPPGHPLWGASLGPSYFEAFGVFSESKITWMVPAAGIGVTHATPGTIAQLKLAYKNIGSQRLDSFEIGNEPNLYVGQGAKAPGYNEDTYVQQWLSFVDDVNENLSLNGKNMFQALTIAWGFDQSQWNASFAFKDGINKNDAVKTVSYHYYQIGNSAQGSLDDLMNHGKIISGLSVFNDPISYMQSAHPDIPFVLGEVGSALGPVTAHALEGVLGSALWEIDMMLTSMTKVCS